MKKEKILYVISILLVVLFLIIVLIDYSKYDATYSAPFTTNILVRALEFLLPSMVIFLVAKFLSKKNKG